MTRITDLTTHVYTDAINPSSTFFYTEAFSAAYKVSPLEISSMMPLNISSTRFVGAMWSQAHSEGVSSGAWAVHTMDHFNYDTGSFTNTNSVGGFYIPNDEYRFAEIMLSIEYTNVGANDIYVGIVQPGVSVDPQSQNIAVPTVFLDSNPEEESDRSRTMVGAVFEVSSGDWFQCVNYAALDTGVRSTGKSAFTLRAIR